MRPAYSIRVRASRSLLPLLLLFSLGVTACGDDDPTDPAEDIIGTWILEGSAGVAYLEVTADRIVAYIQPLGSGCFTFVVYEIEDVDGSTYTLTPEGDPGSDFRTRIERDDDELVIDGIRGYQRTTDDVEDLEICSLSVTCAELTPSSLPADVDGSLADGDLQNPESGFYDLHAFELEGSTTVDIDLRSDDFDAYLTLYDGETGEFLAENDDFVGFDSHITRTLSPGCYIVMASSYDLGLGAYNLTIEED